MFLYHLQTSSMLKQIIIIVKFVQYLYDMFVYFS
jgi:hypothetical protein